MPPHKGHELAIQAGIEMCKKMYVLVSGIPSDAIHPALRAAWLKKTFPEAVVVWEYDQIDSSNLECDEHGTVLSEDFWHAWINHAKGRFGNVDAVFTNDQYGHRLATELNAEWVPTDPNRTLVPISATEIKDNPIDNWKYINQYAKRAFQKRIAVVGPESVGKTTLVNSLGLTFKRSLVVPEYGRTISELKQNKLTEQDFRVIVRGHQTLLQHADAPIVFSDSDVYTTKLFADIYLPNHSHYLIDDIEKASLVENYDLYILLAPTVPWEDDGERILSEQARWKFYTDLKEHLDNTSKNYVNITSQSFYIRSCLAINAVTKLLTEK